MDRRQQLTDPQYQELREAGPAAWEKVSTTPRMRE